MGVPRAALTLLTDDSGSRPLLTSKHAAIIRYGRCPDDNARRRFCPTRDRHRPFLNPPTARFPSSAPGDPELERIRTSFRVLLPGALRQRGRDHALLRELAMKTPYQCQLGASS